MKGSLAFAGALTLIFAVAFPLTLLVVTLHANSPAGPGPLTEVSVDDTSIRFRQPNHGRVRLELATGAAALDEGSSDIGRTPPACLLSEGKACILPNGVFQIGAGTVMGRTDAGAWNAFYFPLHNVRLQAMYAAGDKILIESRGYLSTLECVDARSGRSLWMYVHGRTYNDSGPYAPSVPGRTYDETFERAEWQAKQPLGVNVVDSFDRLEAYAGKMVFDPVAATAKVAASRTMAVACALWLIVGSGAVLWWRRGRTGATILCLAIQGFLLLIFGFLHPALLAAFALQVAVTAAQAWRIAGRGGRGWIQVIVFGTVALLVLPSMLESILR